LEQAGEQIVALAMAFGMPKALLAFGLNPLEPLIRDEARDEILVFLPCPGRKPPSVRKLFAEDE